MKKSCKKGYYYCFTSKKCKKIPVGHHVMPSGRLMKDNEHEESDSGEESTETKKNGNGSNGNGGAVSEGWSEKYKKSIDCKNPKGFSQRAHCQGRKKVNEQTTPNPQMQGMPLGQKKVDNLAKSYEGHVKNQLIHGLHSLSKARESAKNTPLMKSDSVRVAAEAKDYEKDHEVSMAKTQVKKSIDNLRKVARVLAKKTDADNLPAWVQAKLTDTDHNTGAAASYMEQACPICNEDPCQCLEGTVMEGKRDGKSAKDKDYSLRDWFKGGGWVQVSGKYKGKPCAKQKGQKSKPFCRDADDAAAMSPEEKKRRTTRKRRQDPNPDRRGKAKIVTSEVYNMGNQNPNVVFGKAVKSAGGELRDIIPITSPMPKPKKDKNKTESYSNWREELSEVYNEPDPQYKDLKGRNQDTSPTGGLRPQPWKKEPKKDPLTGLPLASARTGPKLQTAGYKPEGNVVEQRADRPNQGGGWSPGHEVKDEHTRNKKDNKPKNPLKNQKPGIANIPTPELNPLSNYPIIRGASGKSVSYNNVIVDEEVVSEEGKKDACYHKVKSRYKIWPSAYASGALVKCRKVGAKNWGNKTKKEGYEFSNWRDDFQPVEIETVDLITADPIQVPPSNLQKIEEKCWVGYKQLGMKKKGKKMVPNCVKEGYSDWRQELEEDWQKVNKKDKTDGMSQKAVNAYKRENPGSKLKTAVTEKKPKGKRAKRRKSFCARSNGQRKMHNIDCSKTPDKAICKARKRWRC